MTAQISGVNEEADITVYQEVQTPKTATDTKDDKKQTEALVSFTKLFTYADYKDKLLMFFGTLAACGSGVAQPLQIIVFGDVVNAFNPANASSLSADDIQDDINRVCLNFVYIAIGVLFLGFGQVACWSITASRQTRRLRQAYVQAILRQEIGWFDVNEPMQLATKVADTTITIQDGMGRKVGDGWQFFAMAVSGIIIGLIKGWKLALALLAFTPLLAFTAFLMMKTIGDAVQGGNEAYGAAGGIAEETLGNVRTVYSFNAMSKAIDKYKAALENTEKAGIKRGLAVGIGTGVMFLTCYCTYAFGMFYGAVLISEDQLDGAVCTNDCYDGGRVLIVFFSVIMGAMALGQAGPSIQAVYAARAAAVSVYKLLERDSKIDPIRKDEGECPSSIKGHILIENVTFRYPSRPDVEICRGYSLEIKPGETVALVGSSGSGKSTIVSLLERFYDPQEGRVELDGKSIQSLNVHWLRSQIGLVGQEPALFATSIANNISYGKENVSMEDIHEAAKKANAYDFIMTMPNGFDTEVGERGVQLSGGQKQRIAIARAIIKDPAILLLDEATSALDTESEKIVQDSLDYLLQQKKRTTIIIAHRLTTIRNADRIAVHHEGKVVELGSHDELMAIPDGHYFRLVETQSRHNENDTTDTKTTQKPTKTASIEHATTELVIKEDTPKIKSNENNETTSEEADDTVYKISMSRLWKLSSPESKYMLIGGIGAAVNGATFPIWGVLLTKVTVLFFELNLSASEMKQDARWWAMAFVLLGVTFCVSIIMQNYGFAIVAERLTKRIRTSGFSAMLRQEIGWFDLDENSSGALTTRLATDSALIQSMTGEMLNRNLVNLCTLGVAFGIAFYYSWEMTLALIAVFPFMAIASYVQMEMISGTGNGKSANPGDIAAGSLLSESIGNVRTVASFGMENRIIGDYYGFLSESKQADVKVGIAGGAGFGISQSMLFLVQAFLFWLGGILVTDGRISFEDMFLVLLAVMLSSFGVGMAMQNLTDVQKAKKAASSVFSIIDRKPLIDSTSTEGLKPASLKGDIQFSYVDFTYPSRPNSQIYQNYTLTIKPGQTVALVGASGSGKSTAICLLERFYDPDNGSVCLDGHELSSLNIRWLREHISLVSQEPILFSGSIAENISYGKPTASREEIYEAAKMANAYDFIQQFPDGFETDVGDRGVQVSGGQKQRIALARAIIRDPEVLLLDEATSALDSESERIVQESLDRLLKLKKRTTIVIAHRLSTIRDADMIAVVDNGAIVETGTHDELMKRDGIYSHLVSRQMNDIH